MKSHLQVKVYTLSQEMSYIHRKERKWKERARIARQKQKQHATEEGQNKIVFAENNFWSMREHRVALKREARTSHLAYGFLCGIPYSSMERFCYGVFKGYGSTEPDWKAIEETVERFAKSD